MRRFIAMPVLSPVLTLGLFAVISFPALLGAMGYRLMERPAPAWVNIDAAADSVAILAAFSPVMTEAPCILVLESSDFFIVPRMAAIQKAVTDIRSVAGVDAVTWCGDLPLADATGDGSNRIGDATSDTVLAAARESLLVNPMIVGQTLSDDAETMLIAIWAWSDASVLEISGVFGDAFSDGDIRARLTGPVPQDLIRRQTLETNHIYVQFTGYGIAIVLALFTFRSVRAAAVAFSGPMTGLVWTYGLLALAGEPHNELTATILPVLVLTIAFADSVHVLGQLRHACRRVAENDAVAGADFQQGMVDAMQSVIPACFLTSLTTAVGFGALMYADSEVIQGFGRSAVIGSCAAFWAVFLVVPRLSRWFLLKWLSKPSQSVSASRRDRIVTLLTRTIGSGARPIAVVAIAASAALLWISSTLEADDRVAFRVPWVSDAYTAMVHCDNEFGGLQHVKLVLQWSRSTADTDVVESIDRATKLILSEREFSRPLSVSTLYEARPELAASDLSVLTPEVAGAFFNRDTRSAAIITRLRDRGMVFYRPQFSALREQLDRMVAAFPGVSYELTGRSIVESTAINRIVDELFLGLIGAGVVIVAIVTVAFRSLTMGLILILPNALPLLLAASIRRWIDPSLDVASACAFAVCLGIAVDDTIHFATHFRFSLRTHDNVLGAVRDTITVVGGPMVLTSFIIGVGFASVLVSGVPSHMLFAAIACIALGAALVADLLVLPAILVSIETLGARGSRRRDNEHDHSATVDQNPGTTSGRVDNCGDQPA